jgi:5-methylcytosine-specific restriction protein B
MARWHRSPEALEAAREWRDRCWMDDGSILSDNRFLWEGENLSQLDRYFVKNPDGSSRAFLEKLQDQLAPTSPWVKQLAAEILWLLYLGVSDTAMKGATKRLQIRQVWEWSEKPLPDSPMLAAPLETGFANSGTGFQTNRWREFAYVVDLAWRWKTLSTPTQAALISDPWEFARWVDSFRASANRQFRHMLLYLLFPDHFERVVTSSHKEQILRKLGPRFGIKGVNLRDRTAVDRALHELRPRLEAHYQAEVVDYFEIPVRGDWLDLPANPSDDPDFEATALQQAREW